MGSEGVVRNSSRSGARWGSSSSRYGGRSIRSRRGFADRALRAGDVDLKVREHAVEDRRALADRAVLNCRSAPCRVVAPVIVLAAVDDVYAVTSTWIVVWLRPAIGRARDSRRERELQPWAFSRSGVRRSHFSSVPVGDRRSGLPMEPARESPRVWSDGFPAQRKKRSTYAGLLRISACRCSFPVEGDGFSIQTVYCFGPRRKVGWMLGRGATEMTSTSGCLSRASVVA